MENGQLTRRCKKCGEVKNLTAFPVYDNKTGARRHACQQCNDARVGEWHGNHVEHRRAQRKAQYWRDPAARWTPEYRAKRNESSRIENIALRERVLAVYGSKCACCGETEKRFLTVDHVNNDGKNMRKVHGSGKNLYRWLIKNGFPPSGFQVLCMNCNFGKAMNKGTCPHQTKEPSTTIPQGSTAKRPEVPRTLAAE